MRRFWMGLAIAIVTFLLTWNAFYLIAPRQIFGYDYAMWEAKRDLVALENESPEVVIFGDSVAVSGLKATETKRRTLNLAIPCGGPMEASFMYDRLLEKHPAPRAIVLSFALPIYYSSDCVTNFFLPYGLDSIADRAEVLERFAHHGRKLNLFGSGDEAFDAIGVPLRVRYGIYLALTALHLSPQQIAGTSNFLDFQNWHGYVADYRRALANRGHYTYGEAESFDGVTRRHGVVYDSFSPNPVAITYLESILGRARTTGSKVVLRIEAINPATHAEFTESFWKDYHSFFDDFQRRHPDLIFDRKWQVLPPNTFGDNYLHANANGSRLLTASLETQLDGVLQ